MLKSLAKSRLALALATIVGLTGCGAGTYVGAARPAGSGSGGSTTPAPGTTSTPAPGATSTPAPGRTSTPVPGTTSTPTPGATSTPSAGTTGTPSAGGNAASGIPFPSATDADPFYAQPSPFPAVSHGTILASRSVTFAPNGVTMSNVAYQVKFASRDIYGRKIAAVETVVEPLVPATGVEPLVVEALAEDSLAAKCAPSHFVTGSAMSDTELAEESGVPETSLTAGDTLLFPDFEGPFSLYAVGPQEGYITLDAEIAALNFAPLGLNAKTPIGQNGYSGGAHAVSWAAALAPTYAPSLNLIGTATGGTPADILGILENIDGTSVLSVTANSLFFDIIFMSGVGINRGFPNLLTPVLNAKGVAAATAMENGCGGDNSDGSSGPTGHFADYVTLSQSAFYADPLVISNTSADSEPQPGIFPTSNVFLYQSVTDELIPVAGADKLDAGWCADGTPLEYFRDTAGGDHVTTEIDNIPIVETYLQERFAGLPLVLPPTTTTCN